MTLFIIHYNDIVVRWVC